jgi:hypothetical protein
MKRQSKRKQRKAALKHPSSGLSKRFVPPLSIEEFFALPEQIQDIYTRVTHGISKMRTEGISLPQAAQEYGITRRQMHRFGDTGLRRLKNGRYAAKTIDRLMRVLVVPTPEGTREIAVNDSRQATVLAEYWNAVQRYLQTGDATALQPFHGEHITDANGAQFPLLTDLAELDRQGNAGILFFESLYAKVG